MSIEIQERYKLIYQEHHYACDFRVKIFTGWCTIYAALAIAFTWIQNEIPSYSWIITLIGLIITILMYLAELRNRAAIKATKDIGKNIESDGYATIPEEQRYFHKINLYNGITHSIIINIFTTLMIIIFISLSVYLIFCIKK